MTFSIGMLIRYPKGGGGNQTNSEHNVHETNVDPEGQEFVYIFLNQDFVCAKCFSPPPPC